VAPPVRGSAPTGGAAPPAAPALADYPVRLEIEKPAIYTRLLPLVKWLLAIPHYVVLVFLIIGVLFAVVASWFAVLITGRYPEGLFNYVVAVQRYIIRVTAYVYLLVDAYPPFSLAAEADHPVSFRIDYPEGGRIARWRPLLHWLLVIPYAICTAILLWIAMLALVVAFFTILFTRNIPDGIFRFIVIAYRWQMRTNAYTYWMTGRYPPFAWG
jgi:hypothetical protein